MAMFVDTTRIFTREVAKLVITRKKFNTLHSSPPSFSAEVTFCNISRRRRWRSGRKQVPSGKWWRTQTEVWFSSLTLLMSHYLTVDDLTEYELPAGPIGTL